MTKKILLTGFEPFGTHRLNSSWEAIRNLNGTAADGAALCSVLLPVEYRQGPAQLSEAIEAYRPDIAISFGLAAGEAVRLERYARNGHRGICDNAGLVPPQPHLEREAKRCASHRFRWKTSGNQWKVLGLRLIIPPMPAAMSAMRFFIV